MNIVTLIHNNQVFAWAVQLGEFFLFLLLLRWYLVRTRQRRQLVSQTRSLTQGTLERTVSMLLMPVGCAILLFLLLSFFSPVLVLSALVVIGLGVGMYRLFWRRKVR